MGRGGGWGAGGVGARVGAEPERREGAKGGARAGSECEAGRRRSLKERRGSMGWRGRGQSWGGVRAVVKTEAEPERGEGRGGEAGRG